ncbi:Crp/Fnr family transcriptional regulator [Cupriavidus gilardii]|uniref:Crp/Fnr family transcriptional regulator n=1 Tax=Cupriavidus gilardii TaxID=82541 RepID=A0ABY4VNU1_9BURK|nr:Crp/Fnr family transcriptional regulator [Cupriavidus gilardii]QQE09523.1 Crp/Fnr family transcriptional regulator [Cupriavidus sp. ISTL7]MCT9071532.1 Crp/Fnr family transcriptional regulator [Cupriavidus gilardii]QKS61607.1 Crp/Fnr family transcriptional regulator [Cupriavidus gilardii]USE77436.1 Crp/Fnr family transcriptional regulator [Cupriavidus gilardii]UXC39117.1 Crp/Fnr family transcriptional regulator [Cupriavidus gilardii]
MGVPPLACPTRAPADAAEGVDALSPLRSGSWFRGLPADMRAALLEAGTIRRLEPGEVLFQRGDPFDGLYAVIAGAVLVHAHDAGGKAALLGLLEAGAWFGEICLFDGLLRTHDARAATRAAVWHVPRARLDAMLAAQPSWWREFGKLLAGKTREAFRYVEEAQLLPPLARTARRLAAIARSYGDTPAAAPDRTRQSHRSIHLPQEQLAQMLGLSRQTVNHALRELEARGLLRLRYADIELLDLSTLETLT